MKTVKTTLKNVVSDAETYNKINMFVIKANKTVILAYQFFKLYFMHCYNNGIEAPPINDQLIKTILKLFILFVI